MHKLIEYIDDEIMDLENKVGKGSKLSERELEYGKDLAKFKMAMLTNEAMEHDGYSGRYDYGRKRDSMGRYSRESFMDKLHDLKSEAPDEHTRRKVDRMISEMR